MIYLTKDINSKLFKVLLDAAFKLGGERIALWEDENLTQKNSQLKKFLLKLSPHVYSKEELEPATEYDIKGKRAVNSYIFEMELINVLCRNLRVLKKHVDSITIYKRINKKWFFSVVFHENMTFFRINKKELKILKTIDVPFSSEPPDGW